MEFLHLGAIESGLASFFRLCSSANPRTEATSLLTPGASKKRHDHEDHETLQPSVRCRKPTLHASWLAAVGQIQKDEVEKWGENG